MKLIYRIIALIVFFLSTYSAFCQSDLDSVSFKAEGKITVEVLYNQYFQEKSWSDTLLSPWGYQFRVSHNPERMFFVFDCLTCYKDYHRNILYLDFNKVRIDRIVHSDSINCCIEIPLIETSIRKRYQRIKSVNWDLITEIVDDGCQDTHYSNLEVTNTNCTVKFKNLNNIRVYELDWFKDRSSLIVVSTRLCRNEIIIYKIE